MSHVITGSYDFHLVILSIVIAILASYTALDLAGRVTAARGQGRVGWLISGSVAMGTGIWSMHFIGMLAFKAPVAINYDPLTVLVSIVPAILASGLALFLVSCPTMGIAQLIGGSVCMGCGIASMHYLGMAAMRVPLIVHYDLRVVAISVVIAIAVSLVALYLAFQLREETPPKQRLKRIASALIMGMAVSTMHYTGIVALSFVPKASVRLNESFVSTKDVSLLATAVGLGTVIILGLALLTASYDRRILASVVRAKTLEENQQHLQTILQQTQIQLVQKEKLSSLGLMITGIAHEINNPINFIYGNLSYASQYIGNLVDLLQLYQHQYPQPTTEIQTKINDIDLDFTIEDLAKILDSMKLGAERICQIGMTLRNFSHQDADKISVFNIHEGLDSSLMILQHRLRVNAGKPEIQVIKHYDDLPLIEGYAGLLNLVFINILTNAIDALRHLGTASQAQVANGSITDGLSSGQPTPTIQIYTEANAANLSVQIRFVDNGSGISEAVKARIFEPFFTTKPVGHGTGLGLSISHQIIVDKHGGSLQCFSTPGLGTEFRIEIPLLRVNLPTSTQPSFDLAVR